MCERGYIIKAGSGRNANMTTFSAKASDEQRSPLQVVFVIYPDIALLDLAGPLQVFAWARKQGTGELAYKTAIASREGGSIPTDSLISVDTDPMKGWMRRQIDTLIVVGGDGVYLAMQNAAFIDSVAKLAARSRRICSVCSGALALAATGILDGRRAVTHWEDSEALTSKFPRVQVEADPIYIKDENIWTSAGVTAGIDMALAIVAEDLGQGAALERAQSLVTYMVRPGGQSQFSPALERQKLGRSGRFEHLHQWIAENLEKDLRVEQLAEREHMSVRNFHRLYLSTMGMTPAKAVEAIRMEAARDLLETTSDSVKAVADRCGFRDKERMRRAFARLLEVSPSEYRRRFRIR